MKSSILLCCILFCHAMWSQESADTISAQHDSTFVNLRDYSNDFVYDMKYATEDNFLKSAVYECASCYLRLATVKALVEASNLAMKKGYRIKIYDCYRPLDVQRKMWLIYPNATYVANPETGSIHNRGGAVDITLVDSAGSELDMGTEFDYFGEKAGHAYKNLPRRIKANRKLLRGIMENSMFKALESEWWHYNLQQSTKFPVSNFTWQCD